MVSMMNDSVGTKPPAREFLDPPRRLVRTPGDYVFTSADQQVEIVVRHDLSITFEGFGCRFEARPSQRRSLDVYMAGANES